MVIMLTVDVVVIPQLLTVDAKQRLQTVAAVQSHPAMAAVDFDSVKARKTKPIFVPSVSPFLGKKKTEERERENREGEKGGRERGKERGGERKRNRRGREREEEIVI